LVLGAAVTLSACDIAVNGDGGFHLGMAAGRAQDEWARTYPMASGGRFELINVNGQITAEATDGNALEVRAEREVRAASDERAKEVLDMVEMREEVGTDRVRVEVRPPRLSGPSSHQIKWTVRVPRGLAVDLRTVNGGVRMDRLEGEVRARSTNGGITGTGLLSTAVDASVTNGGIEIALGRAITSGSFELEAVNGGVSLDLPSDSRADVAARCVNGGISVNGLDVQVIAGDEGNAGGPAQRFRRRLNGQINGGGARVSLETVNGGVKLGGLGASRGTTN
jgi:hypothetical protein